MADKEAKGKYSIHPDYIGLDAWTVQPAYERKDGALFKLDSSLSQKDMGFLHDVLQYPGIVKE